MTERTRMGRSMARTPKTVKAQGEHVCIGTKQADCDVAVTFVSRALSHQNSALFAAASCLNQRLKLCQRETRIGERSGV